VSASAPDPGGGLNGEESPQEPRRLHPLPRGLVELYGLLAVLVVLVPEWLASGALQGLAGAGQGTVLPPSSGAWTRLPELKLASMNLAELRQLAAELRLGGYGRLNRERLSARLLRRLQRQRDGRKAL
jgi:hypothetical protein